MNIKWIWKTLEEFVYEMNGFEIEKEEIALDEENGFRELYEDEYYCPCRFCVVTRKILFYMAPNA